MSYLTDKFKGIYRIRCETDQWTNDYPRKLNGQYEDIDLYISCMYGNKIFYYGKSTLQAYIPSLQRGHNILKQIEPSLVFDIEESDSEVLFRFKYVDSDKIIPLLKPRTAGAGISPFSTKNLEKSDYKIPDEDLCQYTDIVAKIPRDKVLGITHTTNRFLKSLVTKKNTWENIRADMKLKGMKGKEYIHSIGKWNDFICYLRENILVEPVDT